MNIEAKIDENNELLNEWAAILDSNDWYSNEKQSRGTQCRKKLHDNLATLAKQVEAQIMKQKELKSKNDNEKNEIKNDMNFNAEHKEV